MMRYNLPDIRNVDVRGKRVFLHEDVDVPLISGKIEDDTRLVSGMPTITFLLAHGATVIVAGKLGRPEGENYEARSRNKGLSLRPIAQWFSQVMNDKGPASRQGGLMIKEEKRGEFDGWEITDKLFLLENLRFYKEEEENGPIFAQKLAKLADIFVDDAFALSHRAHASNVGVATLLPHFAGIKLQEEVEVLAQVLANPKRPVVVIVGGEKIETKLPLVLKMLDFSDYVLVGGKIAQEIREINPKLVIAKTNENGEDIADESTWEFKKIITIAKTIIWNGPLGKINDQGLMISDSEDTEKGTREIAQAIVENPAYKVVGGGDTTEFVKRIGLLDKFDFVSTGGGAMLVFLSGEPLPALEVLAP